MGNPNTHIHDRSLSWPGTGTHIKSGGFMLVLWVQKSQLSLEGCGHANDLYCNIKYITDVGCALVKNRRYFHKSSKWCGKGGIKDKYKIFTLLSWNEHIKNKCSSVGSISCSKTD